MIVFPLKWLPWILAIGGFIGLVTSGEPFAIVPTLIGVVWLIFIFNNKKDGRSPNSTSQNSSNNTSAYKAPTQTITNASTATNSANMNVCPNCKAPIGSGMSFCMKCGTKVK